MILREQLLAIQHQARALDLAVEAALGTMDAIERRTPPGTPLPGVCAHEKAIDVSTMSEPGKRYCPDCGITTWLTVKEGLSHG